MLGTKILEIKGSKYNGHIKVVRTWGLGTYIQANGLTQSGGVVESMWRQTLKKVKGKKLKVKDVLILGLGGGTLVKIIQKYYPQAKITGVDIDKELVELGQKYLKTDLTGVDVKITDALTFLINNKSLFTNYFDLIIVDLYNGDQFPKKFETESFLKLARSHLSPNGLIVFNRLYYKDKKIVAESFGVNLKKIFKNTESYFPVTNIMYICKKS